MSTFLSSCHVCISDFPVSFFRRLACGHCYCVSCVLEIQRRQQGTASCPGCRAPILPEDPQPIYLDIVGSKPLATTVVEGLGRMGPDAKVASVRTAARKLRQAAEAEVNRHAMDELLAAITDFEQRIVPVFTKARSQETEIAMLKRQLEETEALRPQAERATTLSGEVAMLRDEQLEFKTLMKKINEENDLAKKATAEMERLCRERDALDIEHQREQRRLKGLLERNADDRTKERHKMEGISQQRDMFAQKVTDLEQKVESLKREIRELCGEDLEDEFFASEYSEHSSSPCRASGSTQSTRQPLHASSSLPELQFEGMPQPGFKSDWQLGRGTKRKGRDDSEVAAGFPIAVRHGRATVAVQLGPKHTRRVKVR